MDDRVLRRRVLMATSISYVVVILDTSIVNVALERVATSLGAGIPGLKWAVNAYTLAFASLLLTGGSLADRFGARAIYIVGLLVFTGASALCGLAPDVPVLIMARVLQGVGAALLVPGSLTLIAQAYRDPAERAGAFGLWAALGGIAMAAGPLIGGLLIDALGWRSIFLVNVPIGLAGLAMAARVPRSPIMTGARSLSRVSYVDTRNPAQSDEETKRDRVGEPTRSRLDLAGQALAILALGGVTTCLIEASSLGWLSGSLLGGFAASLGAGAVFLAIEARAGRPMLPLGLFRNGRFSGSVVVSMVSAFVFYGLLFMLSLLFQRQRGWEPLRTGLAFLPLTALVSTGSLISRRAALLLGPRVLVSSAFLLFAFGFLGLFAVGATAPYAWLALQLPTIGLAASLVTPATTVAAMETVGRSRAGIAAGVLNAARQTGAALGVAASGALVAASPSFEDGMRAGIVLSAALCGMAAVVWWVASGDEGRDVGSSSVRE